MNSLPLETTPFASNDAQTVVNDGDKPASRPLTALCLAFSPVALFLAVLLRSSRNIPSGDDYVSLLGFLDDWVSLPRLGERLHLLYSVFGSHHIVAARLLALADRALFGALHVEHLQWIGWAAWIGTWWFLWMAVSPANRRPAVAAVLALLMMQPGGYSNFLIALPAIQNLCQPLVALLACHAAARRGRPAATFCILLCAASPWISTNGLIVAPAAALAALVCSRRRLAAGLALLSALSALCLLPGLRSQPVTLSAAEVLKASFGVAGGAFTLLRLGRRFALCIGAAILLALCGLLARRPLWRRAPALCAFSLYPLLSILLIAVGRLPWGPDYVFSQDRYKLYGVLCAASAFLLLLEESAARGSRRLLTAAGAAAALPFCALSYLHNDHLCRQHAAWAEARAMNRQLGTHVFLDLYLAPKDQRLAARESERAEALGTYRYPVLLSGRPRTETAGPTRIERTPAAGNPTVFDLAVTALNDAGTLDFALIEPHKDLRIVLPRSWERAPLRQAVASLRLVAERPAVFRLSDLPAPLAPASLPWRVSRELLFGRRRMIEIDGFDAPRAAGVSR